MPMRLLPKSELAKAKADAQRQTIDEGVKIARRVDNLREVAQDEERSLEAFRVKTLTALHLDIVEMTRIRDTKLAEVKVAEDALRIARLPLDEEWIRIREILDGIATERYELDILQLTVKERDSDTRTKLDEANALLKTVHSKEDNAISILKDAFREKDNANALMKDVIKVHIEATALRLGTESDAKETERKLTLRRNTIEAKEANIELKLKEMAIREIKLIDREATLEREFKRLKK